MDKKNRGKKIRGQIAAIMLSAAMTVSGASAVLALPSYADSVTDTINLAEPAATSDGYVTVDTTDTAGATVITISNDGTYKLTGSGSNIAVVVAKEKSASLILDSATIDNSSYSGTAIEAVIEGKASSNVSVQLSGTNSIKCNSSNSDMENGIKHHKTAGSALTISGSGALYITGTYDDGIKYKNGTVSMAGGTLSITDCYGDGIQAENINISGGTTNIKTVYGNASTGYYTSRSSSVSGKNTIWESGSTKYERVNVDTGSHKALKAGTKAKSYSYNKVADDDADDYTAGTTYTENASGGITISGGTVNLDTTAAGLKANSVITGGYTATSTGAYIIGSPDDGVHSNNTFSMTGGTLNIAASDDGITAAKTLSITGSSTSVNITDSYEGLEGATVNIGTSGSSDGPSVVISSHDDGINSASKTLTYTYDSSDNEDYNYLKTSVSATSGANTNIYSGSVRIDIDSENAHSVTLANKTVSYSASGDGIDCNGSLNIAGGKTYVFGQSNGDNSPIDTNSGSTLSNTATVLATGCDSMGESTPQSGTGSYITYSGSSTVTAVKAGSNSGGNMRSMSAATELNAAAGPGGNNGPDGNTQPGGGNQPGGDAQPGGNTQQTVVTAGQNFKVSSGSTTLISQKLPYAASFVMFASPDIKSGSSYTVTLGGSSDNTDSSTETGETEDSTDGSTETGETEDGIDSSAETGETEDGTDSSTETEDSTTDSGSINTDSGSTAVTVSAGNVYTVSGNTYTVTAASGSSAGTVTLKSAKNAGTVKVPAAITLADGNTYNVTAIAARAFKGSKIRTVYIGANVSKIAKNCFAGSKATKIVVKSKKLKKAGVKGSLRSSEVTTVKVKVGSLKLNKTYVKKYKKIFTKANAGRKVSVK